MIPIFSLLISNMKTREGVGQIDIGMDWGKIKIKLNLNLKVTAIA